MALSVLFCLASGTSTQSLTELAKKEKERRKENVEQGRKAVIEAEGAGEPITEEERDAQAEQASSGEIETKTEESNTGEKVKPTPKKEPFVPRSHRVILAGATDRRNGPV